MIAGSTLPKSQCPVCYSDHAMILHDFTAEEAAQHFICRESNPTRNTELAAHIEALWGSRHCKVRQCLVCGFGFSDPYVAGDVRFYNLAAERSFYGNERWEFTRTVKELVDMNFNAKRVLEIGAGFGSFLDKIVGVHVPPSGVVALEFGEKAISVLRGKGYKATREDLRNAELDPGFDAIFMFQVLEHMGDLDGLFSRVHSLLRGGGLFFASVPNANSIRFAEENGSLLDMPPNHIGRWSELALKTVGEKHRLQLVGFETEPFSIKQFVKTDVSYSYLRAAQEKGTIANWSRSRRSTRYGKLLAAAVAAASAPRRLNVWRRAAKLRIGGALWAKYQKAEI